MTARVLLVGAETRLARAVAEAAVRAGLAPIFLGTDVDTLVTITADLAGLGPMEAPPSWRAVDPRSATALAEIIRDRDDVLVSASARRPRRASAVIEAALIAGCGYVDFETDSHHRRRMSATVGDRAQVAGARVLPGIRAQTVAAALAIRLATEQARESGHVAATVRVRPAPLRARNCAVHLTAQVHDPVGRIVGRVDVGGPDATPDAAAWAVAMLATGRVARHGVLTPLSAFDTADLVAAGVLMGLHVIDEGRDDRE